MRERCLKLTLFGLTKKNVAVNGYLKLALLEIAQAVEKMMLPVEPIINIQMKEARKIGLPLLLIVLSMSVKSLSYNVVNDFTDSPPFGMYDIFNYLIYYSTKHDKQGLAAYKSTLEGNMHLFVGKVRPAMKDKTDDGKKFY